MADLFEILPEELKPLTPAEEVVYEAARIGKESLFPVADVVADNPANIGRIDPFRTIRAKFLSWLCIDKSAIQETNPRGIRIRGARIVGKLDFESVTIPGFLMLLYCDLRDGINLTLARTKTIHFEGCNTGPIDSGGISVDGSLFWRKMHIKGGINIRGARISGDFALDKTTFTDSMGCALSADGIRVDGLFSMEGIKADGEVSLIGGRIDGNLELRDAIIKNRGGCAINADLIDIDRCIHLKGKFTAEGQVRIGAAKIGAQLSCINAIFRNGNDTALFLQGTEIRDSFIFREINEFNGSLDMRGANIRYIEDDEQSWPSANSLRLDGLEYRAFMGGKTPRSAAQRLKWLRLQTPKPFSTQPYEQLAKVFRNTGQGADARTVLIAKENDLLKYGNLNLWGRLTNWFFGVTLGHGYIIKRILFASIFMLIIGLAIFLWADLHGIMQPCKEGIYVDKVYLEHEILPTEYLVIEWGIYSLDALIPLVNLHQEDYWLSVQSASDPISVIPLLRSIVPTILIVKWGWWVRVYFWIHISMGWILTSLLITYISGKVRKE